ncbi:MAG TPA: head GIN domain-containing protein [Myxococcales bacterium]|nr:head GIN domain-containing protein [Myxococcales bacterium]
MRIAAVAAAAAALALSATALAGKGGNGHLVTETRNVRGFTAVEIQVPMDVAVREGREFQVKVTVDEDLVSAVKTELRGDTLVVRADRNIDPSGDARVEITLPDLRAVGAAGSGNVSATTNRRKDMSLAHAGSGDLVYRGPAAHLKVGSTGSGDVTVELTGDVEDVEVGSKGSGDILIKGGHARELVAASAGSGSIQAEDLTAHDGKLATSASGDIEATLEGGHASFAVAGSGSITWHGSADISSQARAGSGDIVHE